MDRFNNLQLLTYASLAASSLVMPLYARELGADTGMIGLIGAAYGLASFLSNYIFGRAGDVADRRLLLLFGFLASAVAFASQYLAATPATFLLTRFAAGFAIGVIPPTLAAYVYDVRRPLGKFTSYNAVGWLLASACVIAAGYATTTRWSAGGPETIRSFLIERVGAYESLFLASGLFCLVAFFASLRLRPMRLGLKVAFFPRGVLRRNAAVYVAVFIRHVGAAGIWIVYPIYIVSELGGSLAMVGWVHIINMVSQILVFRNVERFQRLGSSRSLILIGLGLSALTFYSFTLAQDAYQLLPLQIPLGISFACLWLGSMKEVMEHNVERATSTGLLNASINLSNVAGPLLGGYVAVAFGLRGTMIAGALITLVALALYLTIRGPAPSERGPTVPTQAGPTGEVTP